MCFEDKVKCKKDEQQCLGSCSGDTTSVVNYDFATMLAVGELNEDVLGEDGYIASAANCTLKTHVLEVPLFEGGDSFTVYATRIRIRCARCRQV
jgi:hypothetical protein